MDDKKYWENFEKELRKKSLKELKNMDNRINELLSHCLPLSKKLNEVMREFMKEESVLIRQIIKEKFK